MLILCEDGAVHLINHFLMFLDQKNGTKFPWLPPHAADPCSRVLDYDGDVAHSLSVMEGSRGVAPGGD